MSIREQTVTEFVCRSTDPLVFDDRFDPIGGLRELEKEIERTLAYGHKWDKPQILIERTASIKGPGWKATIRELDPVSARETGMIRDRDADLAPDAGRVAGQGRD